jgi:acetoin utilization protein AcuB
LRRSHDIVRRVALRSLAADLHRSRVMSAMTHEMLLGSRASQCAKTTIAEVMTKSPHTIGRDQRLARAHDMMREHNLRHLPVLDGGRLVGVLSQRDLYFVEALAGVDDRLDPVAEAMASEVYVVAPGECVSEVARMMGQHKYGCAVVVDCGHVVGIFTATDALALLAKAMS